MNITIYPKAYKLAFSVLQNKNAKTIIRVLPGYCREIANKTGIKEITVNKLLLKMESCGILESKGKMPKIYSLNTSNKKRLEVIASKMSEKENAFDTAYNIARILEIPERINIIDQINEQEGMIRAKIQTNLTKGRISQILSEMIKCGIIKEQEGKREKQLTVNKKILRYFSQSLV